MSKYGVHLTVLPNLCCEPHIKARACAVGPRGKAFAEEFVLRKQMDTVEVVGNRNNSKKPETTSGGKRCLVHVLLRVFAPAVSMFQTCVPYYPKKDSNHVTDFRIRVRLLRHFKQIFV
jgi:hypothetical protein